MDWKYWIGIIVAGIPGIISLIILFLNRPNLTVKILKNSIEFLHPDDGGGFERLDNEIDIDKYSDYRYSGIKLEVIFSNKGNKKTTINQIHYKNSKYLKEIKINKNLIPLDIGESIKREYYIKLNNIDELNSFYGENVESSKLIVIDHRDKKHTYKLNSPKMDTQN